MKEEITEPKPKVGIVKNLYYAHFAAIPTLMLIGISVGTGSRFICAARHREMMQTPMGGHVDLHTTFWWILTYIF